jgi:hypothetical protein
MDMNKEHKQFINALADKSKDAMSKVLDKKKKNIKLRYYENPNESYSKTRYQPTSRKR